MLFRSLEVKASKDTIAQGINHTVLLDEKGLSGVQGFGLKLWLDALPLVDVEVTGNLQFGYYDVALQSSSATSSTPVSFDLGVPGLEGKPFFARAYGDAAVLYPFLKFPPLVNLIKIYAGGGLSYGTATPIVTPKFAKDALTKANYDATTQDDVAAAQIIVKAAENADFETGLGWFLQLGAHAKLPILPIVAYADLKYAFPGTNPALVDGDGLTLELGGGLAF